MYFIILCSALFLCILVGAFADSKRRNGGMYFFLSVVIATVVLCALMKSNVDEWGYLFLIIGPLLVYLTLLVVGPSPGSLMKCPKCAEVIKSEASVCRFCKYVFPK